jgi:hypothetical protein
MGARNKTVLLKKIATCRSDYPFGKCPGALVIGYRSKRDIVRNHRRSNALHNLLIANMFFESAYQVAKCRASSLVSKRRPAPAHSRNSKLVSVLIANDEAGIIHFVDRPGRREAAGLIHFRRPTLTALAGRSGWSGTINCKPAGQVARARRSATVCAANGMPGSTSTSMR